MISIRLSVLSRLSPPHSIVLRSLPVVSVPHNWACGDRRTRTSKPTAFPDTFRLCANFSMSPGSGLPPDRTLHFGVYVFATIDHVVMGISSKSLWRRKDSNLPFEPDSNHCKFSLDSAPVELRPQVWRSGFAWSPD